jgi:tetratricopeptide (TPR) repeat protein/transcriptional regulator with XRE-family HTH domain
MPRNSDRKSTRQTDRNTSVPLTGRVRIVSSSNPIGGKAGVSSSGGQFGDRLRARRQGAGLSQQELAERSGLSVRSISNLERGRTQWPYRDSVSRLADALGLREADRAEFMAAASRRLPYLPDAGPQAAGPSPADEVPESSPAQPGTRRGGRVVPQFLPAAVPAFVGRQEQLAVLSQVLNQPGGTALITAIGGTAGVGKTALALQWAHQVAAEFPDGQLYADLRGFSPSGAPVTAAEAVRLFLDALQIPSDQIPQTVEAQLGLFRSLLAGKRMLVVLDNARDVAQVRPLLPGSPTCRVVITSRSQLTGLTAIEAAYPLRLDVLPDAEARRLLERRLGAARLAAEPAATAQIIRSCARLPLALSVIAARAAMRPDLSLEQVAADLAARTNLDAFAGGGDPSADVRAAFSWSYRQLEADAARLFRLASLHPGPSLDGHTAAALAGMTVEQAAAALDVLGRAYLIQPAGADRYGQHDLLRSYARELADAQEGEAALTRLLDYYLYAAAQAMDVAFPAEKERRPRIPPSPTPPPDLAGQTAALAWLGTERPSLIAVAVYAAEHDRPRQVILLAAILFRYLDTTNRFADAMTLHGHARRAAVQSGDRAAEAYALVCLGLVDGHVSRYDEAASQLGQAVAISTELGDRVGQARAANYLGLVDLRLGRYQEAVGHLGQALAWAREAGDRHSEAFILGNLGRVEALQGRYEQAAGHQQRALELLAEVGDRNGAATVRTWLANAYRRLDRYPEAVGQLQQALAQFRELSDRQGQAHSLCALGEVDLQHGNYQDAAVHLRQALSRFQELGDRQGEVATRNSLGEVALATGHPADAREQYSAALVIAAETGEKYEQARARDGLGASYQASDDPRRARRHWQAALELYTELGVPEAEQVRARLAEEPASVSG